MSVVNLCALFIVGETRIIQLTNATNVQQAGYAATTPRAKRTPITRHPASHRWPARRW